MSTISKPGVYELPEAGYHADPVVGGSLSCSGMKLLMPPGCPALYEWARKHPPQPNPVLELGSAAHASILGTGWPVVVSPHGDTWRPAKARDWADGQRAAGKIPILPADREQVTAMAAAIAAHPTASLLLQADDVWHESSFFWVDDETGIWCRARMDAVKLRGRVVITDYKTCQSADPDEFAKAAGRYRYHWQAEHYCDAVTHVTGDVDPLFLFVAQEKTPPYVTAIYELDLEARLAGRERVGAARRKYAECAASGHWPGPQGDDTVTRISLPRWAL